MDILVVGGAGYVGSHVCEHLYTCGFTPVVVDYRGDESPRLISQWAKTHCENFGSKSQMQRIIDQYDFKAVVHLGGSIQVGESVRDPVLYYHNNLVNTISLIEVLRNNGINNLVFSSTAAVYGMPKKAPIVESSQLIPINPYGRSKLAVENVLGDYSHAYGFKSVSLRYFNAAGASKYHIGENHGKPETHLIPAIFEAVVGERPNIVVFGTDYDTPDGTCIRDYVHVSDLADAHVRAIQYLLDGGDTTSINLGSNGGYSVREIIDMVELVTGKTVPQIEGERRAGDPPVLVADNSLANKLLGWQPKESELKNIVQTAWNWFQIQDHVKSGNKVS